MSIHYSFSVRQIDPDNDPLLVEEVSEEEIKKMEAALQQAGYKMAWDNAEREPVLVQAYDRFNTPLPLANALRALGTYEFVRAVIRQSGL